MYTYTRTYSHTCAPHTCAHAHERCVQIERLPVHAHVGLSSRARADWHMWAMELARPVAHP
eukprot:3977403-Alexandrium_andersonii.AAC.1